MSRFLPDLQSGASPPEYAIDAQKVNIIKIDLSVARDKARINIGGSLVWVVDASDNFAECDFFFREEQTDGIPLRLGSKISGVRFSRSAISNAAQPGQWVKILYAADRGEFLGIENPWQFYGNNRPASYDKQSFFGGARQIAAVNQCTSSLLNPADSGVICIIDRYEFSSDVAGSEVKMRGHNAGLAVAHTEENKWLGDASPICEVSSEDTAAFPGTLIGSASYTMGGGSVIFDNINFILEPGTSLIIQQAAGGNFLTTFYWREYPY